IFIAGLSYGALYNAISKIPFATSSFGIAAILIVVAAILWGMDGKLRSLVIEDKKD
ncbi:MAG: MFS transporter, partial [Oribacterium parvum]|nr:MFS transporter [Oribacterium parvum]